MKNLKLSPELIEAIAVRHSMHKWLMSNTLAKGWEDTYDDFSEQCKYVNKICKEQGIYGMPWKDFDVFAEIHGDADKFAEYCHEYGYAA